MRSLFITVDVETDWGGRLPANREHCKGIEEGVPQLLRLFEEHHVKGTFFISGVVAPLYKSLIREMVSQGHEVASHGFDHMDHSVLSRSALLHQLQTSKETLESITQQPIQGFRIPQFRLHPQLFDTLVETGYRYDSSTVCGRLKGRYNYTAASEDPHWIRPGLLEIPISKIPRTNKPLGLLWVNHLGFSMFKMLEKISKRRDNIIMYLHPFDVLKHKDKQDYSWFIQCWYRYRAGNVLNTLQKFIQHHAVAFERRPLQHLMTEGANHGR